MPKEPEIVDVDAFEPEIQYICTTKASSLRHRSSINRVPTRSRKRSPEVIVLDHDDDEPMLVEPSSSGSRKQMEQSSSTNGARDNPDNEFRTSLRESSNTKETATFHVSPSPGKFKRKKSEYLDMHPDNDNKSEVHARPISQRRRVSDSPDGEDEYTNYLGALDDSIHNWQPFRNPEPEEVFTEPKPLTTTMESTQKQNYGSHSSVKLHHNIARRFDQPVRSSGFRRDQFVWTALRNSFPVPNRRESLSSGMRSTRQTLQKDLRLENLKRSMYFRDAAGPIQKITQSSGIIAFCGAALGGGPDEDDRVVPDPSNRAGSLMVWFDGKLQVIYGHERNRRRRDHASFYKHYTVHDVILNSTSDATCMVSSGYDCNVRIWSCIPDESNSSLSVNLEQTVSYKKIPLDLAFKPGESILSVACKDGNVYVYPKLHPFDGRAETKFPVVPPNTQHAAGAVTWGLEATSRHLFTSSEPHNIRHTSGVHRAYDLGKSKLMYDFDAKESGDAMALDPHGDRLALCTRGTFHAMLRLYDVRRKCPKAIYESKLEPSTSTILGIEVNRVRFSPDTIYLAVARNDNVVHVYDSRMIERGVLHAFEHARVERVFPGMMTYGVVESQWLESRARRLGLVTGGTDGCIRLWDVCKASDDPANGTIIAQADSDIGHFSVGDVYKGEKALVIGDCGAAAYILD